MRRLLVFLFCVLLVIFLTLVVAPAGADVFGPISLVSEGPTQQVDYAHDPAISGDGRYVAFDGSFGGVTGVWRRNLVTGAVEQVAGGDAELPSISEDGRYISFTTTARLDEENDTNSAPDVYVRDMSRPDSQPCPSHWEESEKSKEECAFALVSAVTGSARGLSYEYGSNRSFEAAHYGSEAVGRSALSADGRELAFVTTAESNLLDPHSVNTPALQVALRYLATDTTKLVSTNRETGGPVSVTEGTETHGAVYPGTKVSSFGPPPPYGKYGSVPPTGASISADGSTVAWMGANIGEQAPLLSGESRSPEYTEPLWRRIAPGSETPTERVTGGSDPQNPACVASGETALPASPSLSDPCQGPFATPEAGTPRGILAGGVEPGLVPRLSKDGYTVAFISRAPLVSLGQNFGRGLLGQPSDLYVADMRAGLTREQALTQLTELAGGESSAIAATASILEFDISPAGDEVAFATKRTQFPLGSPAYVSAPAAEPGMDELFDVDLRDHTLTRVTHGYEGGASEHPHLSKPAGQDPYEDEGDGALSPSFSADGNILAFSSTASNLVWGDGNTPPAENGGTLDGSDAFVVSRALFGSTPTPQYVSNAPGPSLTPAWDLGVTALSRPDGSVELYVKVPGGGKLRALARGVVLVRSTLARRARTSVSRRRQGRPATIATRTVAVVGAYPESEELLALTLKLAKPYASLASARGGLSASVSLVFTARGHPTLRQSIEASFRRTTRASRRAGKGHGARRGGRR